LTEEKVEGAEKVCGNCKTELICVKIVSEWQGKSSEKLQWQSKQCRKAHFKYAGPGKFNCQNIESSQSPEQTPEPPKEQPKKEPVNLHVKVAGPFDEAELIVRWARERAYKMVMVEVSDYSRLTQPEKNSLGQKEGMLTRALVDTTLELMKMHGIKTNYGADD